MQIIPAMDLRSSRCVRLRQGDYSQETVYAADPLEVVRSYVDGGSEWIHCVDLEGARSGGFSEWNVLESLATEFPELKIQVGGGVRSFEQAQRLIDAGAEVLVIGTQALRQPDEVATWIQKLGAHHFCIGLDLKDGRPLAQGWTEDGGVELINVLEFYRQRQVNLFLCTDISRDGMLQGPNYELYSGLVSQYVDCQWIASGGVSSLEDLRELQATGVQRVVIGKALFEGRFTFQQAREAVC